MVPKMSLPRDLPVNEKPMATTAANPSMVTSVAEWMG